LGFVLGGCCHLSFGFQGNLAELPVAVTMNKTYGGGQVRDDRLIGPRYSQGEDGNLLSARGTSGHGCSGMRASERCLASEGGLITSEFSPVGDGLAAAVTGEGAWAEWKGS